MGKLMVPAVYWILSWQDNKPWQYSFILFALMMGEAEILNTWHLFREWGLYTSPDIVQIGSGLLHFWWEQVSFFLNLLSLSTTSTGHLTLMMTIRFLLCSSATQRASLILVAPHPVRYSLMCWSSWVSPGTSGYPFMVPISLTHVQVQYWLALSTDNISI